MKKFTVFLLLMLPIIAFASTGGDTTFNTVVTQLTSYTKGSLGLLFVLMGFLGAAAAVAGFASMKVMFPVFGLTLALRYGADILTTIFGATGYYSPYMHHTQDFSVYDLSILMVASVVFVIGYFKRKECK